MPIDIRRFEAAKDLTVDEISSWNNYEALLQGLLNLALTQLSGPGCQCKTYTLLKVTVVLTARDDGTEALAEVVNGKVRPIAPNFRDPQIHVDEDDNYIRDWITLANSQLLQAGACFGLDVENINYVLEHNTMLHTRECWDDEQLHLDTSQFFEDRANESPDNPYRDSLILLFRQGKNASPAGQACSGLSYSYILMPGFYRTEGRYIDGTLVFGNDHLTHELGHFVGLVHVFPNVASKLNQLASRDNPKMLPLIAENLAEMNNITEQDIVDRRNSAAEFIATWPYSLEQDIGGNADYNIPDSYGITDTPVDLGYGLPLVQGDNACTGSPEYTFARYKGSDLEEIRDSNGKLIWWEPKPGTTTSFESTVTINDKVRKNLMSYWYCHAGQRTFSPDQVKRMHYVLQNLRGSLVNRTIRVPCLLIRIPLLVRRFIPPWEPVTRIARLTWGFIQRVFFSSRREAINTIRRANYHHTPLSTELAIKQIIRTKELIAQGQLQSAYDEECPSYTVSFLV